MLARNALKQLNDWNDCRGQGYDNGSNMSGIHNGVQAVMRRDNEAALYSPCACHSLNLCGSNAACAMLLGGNNILRDGSETLCFLQCQSTTLGNLAGTTYTVCQEQDGWNALLQSDQSQLTVI